MKNAVIIILLFAILIWINIGTFNQYSSRQNVAKQSSKKQNSARKPEEKSSGLPDSAWGENLLIKLGGNVTLEMTKIHAGTFQIGSANSASFLTTDQFTNIEKAKLLEESPVHLVKISKDYYIGKYEVTQEQWNAIMSDGSLNTDSNNHPVVMVSWNDICDKNGFLEKLNKVCPGGYKWFRLPTEAEWEYACRAGSNTEYYWGDAMDGDYCWHHGNSDMMVHPVGQKKTKCLGII